jgi:hypothetical protein
MIPRRASRIFLLASLLSVAACHVESNDASTDQTASSAPSGSAVEVASFPNEATIDVVSDGTNAYVTTMNSTASEGRVVSIGPSGVRTLASMSGSPWALVADDRFVYFTVHGGDVSRVSKTSGEAPLALTSDARAIGIAVVGSNVYYTSTDGVHRVSTSGTGDALFAVDTNGAEAIVADDAAVYWMDRGVAGDTSGSGAIKRADAATGAVTTLADGLSLSALTTFTLAQDATSLYFPDPVGSRVYRVRKTDGALTTQATLAPSPVAVAVDDASVYVASESTPGGVRKIESAPKSGSSAGVVTDVASTAQSGAFALAVDTNDIWYTNYVATGSVYRLPKALQ